MPGGEVEGMAMRLLRAFYDLSGEKLNEPVPLERSGEDKGAAEVVNIDSRTSECKIAIRYLLDQDYIQEVAGEQAMYTITVPGIDRVRETRGMA